MTKRIFRAVFGVAMVMMLSITALVMGMMYEYFSNEQYKQLRSQAIYVAAGTQMNGQAYLLQTKNLSNRVTWIDEDGAILFDSKVDPTNMNNHKDREEIIAAFENGEGSSVRYSATILKKTVNYAVKLQDGTIIRVSEETISLFSIFLIMLQPLVVILVASILVSVALSFRTAKKITKPINDIDLERPELEVVYDELTPLLRRIAVQNKQLYDQMRELERQKQEFDTITSNMQEGILVLDMKAEVLSYNKGALLLMGIESPKDSSSVYELNRSEGFRRCVESALSGNHREENIQLADKVCQVFANPVTQERMVAGAILVLLDVTEREEREGLRREFTANVSHELKTPLTSISGFAEIMKNGMVKEADVPRFASNIYDEAQRLIQMVQDIIKLSKLDEKQIAMEKATINLESLVREVVKRLEPIAEKKGVTILVDTEPVSVVGVYQVLQEMVYNLCDNGIRYNRTDGMLTLTLQNKEKEVLLLVSDTGIGIAKANQSRIFERFYRVNESRSKETEGTGLGLSIVKHGAKLHNATVGLVSELEKGTTISISFPK
ncbi:MAG: ATP-binding protein [Anaerotignum sp.]